MLESTGSIYMYVRVESRACFSLFFFRRDIFSTRPSVYLAEYTIVCVSPLYGLLGNRSRRLRLARLPPALIPRLSYIYKTGMRAVLRISCSIFFFRLPSRSCAAAPPCLSVFFSYFFFIFLAIQVLAHCSQQFCTRER